MIAALYVDPRGCYAGLPDVEVWDEARDARTYAGPYPVVAHPPCSRWCRLAGLVEARWGHKRGEDGGCFAAALRAVRTWGGVLEHPAYTDAWPAFGLPAPPRGGGWQQTLDGGLVCHVEQGRYGHRVAKPTWLYAHGIDPTPLCWGESTAVARWDNRTADLSLPHLPKSQRAATPPAFRDALIGLARSVERVCISPAHDVC